MEFDYDRYLDHDRQWHDGELPKGKEIRAERVVRLPYYDCDGITIYNADFNSVLPQLDNIDCIITDPPYGMDKADWDKVPQYGWYENAYKILKENAALYVFCGENSYIEARTNLEKYYDFQRTIIWQKENVYGGGDYLLAHEYLLYGKKGKPIFNNIGRKSTSNALKVVGKEQAKDISVWKSKGFNNTCAEYVGHPTQKPLQIISKAILNSTTENGVILDLFAGSGSTLLAAKKLGRKAIGIEINKKWCDVAVKRLAQIEMFS